MDNVIYIREFDFPFCKLCSRFINDDKTDTWRHFYQTHKFGIETSKSIEGMVENARGKSKPLDKSELEVKLSYTGYGEDGKLVQNRDEVLPVIDLLPIEDGYQCSSCFYIAKNKKQASSHIKSCAGSSTIRSIRVQHLFGGNATRYFRVEDKAPEKCNWLLDRMETIERSSSGGINEESDDVSEMGSLLSVLRFDEHLKKHGIDMLVAHKLCCWDHNVEEQNMMRKAISLYVDKALAMFRRNVFIKTHNFMGSQMHLSVKDETLNRYKYKVVTLLYFMVNCLNKLGCKKGTVEQIPGIMLEKHVSLLKDLRKMKWENTLENNMISKMHELFRSLFFSSNVEETDSIPFFVSCSSIVCKGDKNDDVRFISGQELSPFLAALLHFMRCVVVQEVYGVGSKIGVEEGKTRPISVSWKNIHNAVSENRDSGASYVRYCMNICNNIRSTEMSEVRFILCNKHEKCGILDGHELSLSQLGRCVGLVQGKMKQILDKELLFGFLELLTPSFWTEVNNLSDHYSKKNESYWFGNHPANKGIIRKWRGKLIDHLHKVGFSLGEGKVDEVKARMFLDSTEEFLRHLFWLMEATGGGPARGSELRTVKVQNGPLASRHVFINNGTIFYVLTYHKGRAKMEGVGKPIARFLDEESSNILIIYLIFVKPLERVLNDMFHVGPVKPGDGNIVKMRSSEEDKHLFSSKGVRLSEWKLHSTFPECMKMVGCEMNVRQYRQYHGGAVKSLLNGFGDVDLLNTMNVTNILHEQTGHSSEIASDLYGVSECDMRKLDGLKLERYRMASNKWHKALGLQSKIQKNTRENDEENDEKTVVSVDTKCSMEETPVGFTSVPSGVWKHLLEKLNGIAVIEKKLEDLSRTVNNHNNENYEGDRGRIRERPHNYTNEMLPISSEDILKAMRIICNKEHCQFRSRLQEKSLLMVCSARDDGLFIFPTGSGKSMLFLVPSFIRRESISIVIVPLVALQTDLLRACSESNIQAVTWENRHTAGTRIVLVSVEHTTKEIYREFVLECFKRGILHAIYVEEAHLFLQWDEFRTVFSRVTEKLRPSGVLVPLYGLTATCPPKMEDKLEARLGMRSSHTVRLMEGRKNISYIVETVKEDETDIEYRVFGIIRTAVAMECNENEKKIIRIIIYCLTREECERNASGLSIFMKRARVSCYHAGMAKSDRKNSYELWKSESMEEQIYIMVATSAFGCGIDIPDVRIVFHIGVPRSIMGFIQESGRAGRDGETARSIVVDIKGLDLSGQLINCNNGQKDDDNQMEQWSLSVSEGDMFGNMRAWIASSKHSCRRWLLEEYNDGIASRMKCNERGWAPCDLCTLNGIVIDKERGTKKNEVKLEVHRSSQIQSRNSMDRKTTTTTKNEIEVIDLDGGTDPHFMEDDKGCNKESKNKSTKPGNEWKKRKNECRTPPPVKRRLILSDTTPEKVTQPSSTSSTVGSQSQQVRTSDLMEMVLNCNEICVPCSIKEGRCIRHNNGIDTQNRECYSDRCLRCASRTHVLKDCFMLKFEGRKGSCYRCSLSFHANEKLHPEGMYGNMNCPNNNALRLLTCAFEERKFRVKMDLKFPQLADIRTNEELIQWLRQTDKNGHTWYADAVKWIMSTIKTL
ncbi:MAG: helicase-related protein [Chlamydiota bacterium]